MTSYSKYNIVYRLQKWMDSVPGQTFLNYAYSWGASIVILGTLFKLTHLPGANLMLFFGMGTEVVVFFLSAFDRPFDKTADGMDLPSHVTKEHLEGTDVSAEQPTKIRVAAVQQTPVAAIQQQQAAAVRQPVAGVQQPTVAVSANASTPTGAVSAAHAHANAQTPPAASTAQGSPLLADIEVVEATSRYIDELNKLTETLEKVSQQSARLTRDSEEMENLNRTLTGINKVYELHLKSISLQVGTIDDINNQTKILADQIQRLNQVYGRMIDALTVNVVRNGGSVEQPPQQ